jgi:hypothetical protein
MKFDAEWQPDVFAEWLFMQLFGVHWDVETPEPDDEDEAA